MRTKYPLAASGKTKHLFVEFRVTAMEFAPLAAEDLLAYFEVPLCRMWLAWCLARAWQLKSSCFARPLAWAEVHTANAG